MKRCEKMIEGILPLWKEKGKSLNPLYNCKNPFVSKITADFCLGAFNEQHKENYSVFRHFFGRTCHFAVS